jgi:flagellar basal-body rod protein FlgB
MAIVDFPILSMLRTRMQWHQERQRLLAENVANADMPNFRPRDLAPLKFDGGGMIALARTADSHTAGGAGATQFRSDRSRTIETRPGGNSVNLEDEMLKVAANQMDYQAATALYSRSLGLLKTALGRK